VDSLYVEYKGPDTNNEWAMVARDILKSDESVVTAIGSGSDNGPEDSFKVHVYPNPTTQDNVNVIVETVLPTPVRVRLVDPVGRNLFDGVFPAEEVLQGIRFTPPGVVHAGMYVVMVDQGNIRVREKVIIRQR
jgi:hypothetical protein